MNERPVNPLNPADKTTIVVQGGHRVTGSMPESDAKKEADRLNAINEASGQPGQPPAKVVRNLMG